MISAREFYKLQKLQHRGKLQNNPTASALVAEVTKKVLNSQQNAANVGHTIPATPNVSTSSDHDNTAKRRKKSRKRKRKPRVENDHTTADDVNKLLPDAKSDESIMVSPTANCKLSRSQRKKLRKKLKKGSVAENTDLKSATVVNTQSTKLASNAKRPPSPCQSSAFDTPGKRPRLPEEHMNVITSVKKLGRKTLDENSDEHILRDPVDMGKKELEHILAPLPVDEFFKKYFEKHPLFLQRKARANDWLTTQDLDNILREARVMFTEHLDVASYRDGQRFTLNPPGRAFRSVVWDLYNSGCSLRLLCPQVFFKHIRHRLSLLHEYFGCFVGCNVYLTPPGSQGFAPHYDDIEAFIVQLEGSKRWRVYAPRNASEKLPRLSSPNLTQEELGEPTLIITLNPGDLLYLPRGYIHQADTNDGSHSLHLTLSTYQKHTWGDFISKLLPIALQTAIETNVTFREGLPIGILQHVGGFVGNTEQSNESKPLKEFRAKVVSYLRLLTDLIERPTDASDFPNAVDPLLSAADLLAVDLIGQALPPQLSEAELACHVLQQGEHWKSARSDAADASLISPGVVNAVEIKPNTKVRLVRWSAVRAVRTRLASQDSISEDEESSSSSSENGATATINMLGRSNSLVAVYHSLSNTNVFKERELDEMALDAELLPALDYLARAFPKFVSVDSLPLSNLDDQLRAAVGMYEAGFLVTDSPLPAMEVETAGETLNQDDYSSEDSEEPMTDTFCHGSVDLDCETSTDGDEEEGDSGEHFLFDFSDSSEPPPSEDAVMPTKRDPQHFTKRIKNVKRKSKH